MDADPHGQAHTVVTRQGRVQRAHRLDHAQAGAHGPLGVVFMGLRIAKVHQQPITEILRDIPLKALDHGGAGLLIRRTMSRQSSGSSCRARRVESTRSQNSTVSWRCSASARDGALAAGSGSTAGPGTGSGAVGTVTAWPHLPQKRAVGSLWAPHCGHTRTRACPHAVQNRWVARAGVWHCGHRTTASGGTAGGASDPRQVTPWSSAAPGPRPGARLTAGLSPQP